MLIALRVVRFMVQVNPNPTGHADGIMCSTIVGYGSG